VSLVIACAVGLAGVPAARGQAHAIDPLPTPHFSIDKSSPTIGGALTADDVLDKPGPSITYSGANLGLGRAGDELNALSQSRNDVVFGQTFMLLFGVDRSTVGLADPDPALVADNRPFNVKHQAHRNQAAGDMFMALDPFDRSGPILATGQRAPVLMNNTLVLNQADMGGGDFDLLPLLSAAQQASSPIDNSDDWAYDVGTSSLRGAERGIEPPIFFCVQPGSPSLPLLPGTNSGADVYIDAVPGAPGGEALYASPADLGLFPGDVIDALVVFDDGNNQYDMFPSNDQVLFSVARSSQILFVLPGTSAADVFVSRGRNSPLMVYVQAEDLGLSATSDNLDGLEVLPTADPTASIHNHALFLVIPGDYDANGVLDSTDCAAFAGCFSGSGLSYDSDGVTTQHVSVGPGDFFVPAISTIETGDQVRWTWNGGVHNVVSGSGGVPNGYFYSGPPTGTLGTIYNVTFDEAFLNRNPVYQGSYPYFSQVPNTFTMTGTIRVQADPCATFDLDFDGDVDCADWQSFRGVYAEFNPGAPRCPLLTISDFVAVLLTKPAASANVCLADMNGDGRVDGKDVQRYIDAYRSP